jgi:hypothetical protein
VEGVYQMLESTRPSLLRALQREFFRTSLHDATVSLPH